MNRSTGHAPTPRRGLLRRALRGLRIMVFGCALAAVTAWSAAALHFDVRVPWLRTPLAVAYLATVLALWILVRRPWARTILTATSFGLVLAWWLTLQPSNDRDWRPDVAVLAHATIDGNRVTVHNVRHCEYRTETDFDVRHGDRTYTLDDLRSVDLYMVYWGSPHMAHTMISFGFASGDYLCFSIETRMEKGESYSAVRGLFRQFELVYVVADERDVVRLRTSYRRGEEVYLHRLRGTPGQVRQFFLDYLDRLNRLRERPEWYNALTDNCTTSIRVQRAAADRAPWDWRLLANGHGDELLYERDRIANELPLAEVKERAHINARARAADAASDFSRRIRQGIPGIDG